MFISVKKIIVLFFFLLHCLYLWHVFCFNSHLFFDNFMFIFFFLFYIFFSDFIGTPSARPVRWMVGQVSTEVRKLRERAERANDSAYTPRAR